MSKSDTSNTTLTQKTVESIFDRASDGYDFFSPHGIFVEYLACRFHNIAPEIGVSRLIAAKTLSCGEEFVQYLRDVAEQANERAETYRERYFSLTHKLFEAVKFYSRALKHSLGLNGDSLTPQEDKELDEQIERKDIAENQTIAWAYSQMAKVADNIYQRFGIQTKDVISGLVGLDNTFSNETEISNYVAALNPVVKAIWTAGTEETLSPIEVLVTKPEQREAVAA